MSRSDKLAAAFAFVIFLLALCTGLWWSGHEAARLEALTRPRVSLNDNVGTVDRPINTPKCYWLCTPTGQGTTGDSYPG